MVHQPRRSRIDRGVGQYGFNDYYAVLGLPITVHMSVVRKRYIAIVKRLHPDVFGFSPHEKELANQYLSKMVNPAYNVLNQERERTEYTAILRLLAKRLIKGKQIVTPKADVAKKLLRSPNTMYYEQAITAIAEKQYDRLERIIDSIALISELNLVYLLTQEGYQHQEVAPLMTPQPETVSVRTSVRAAGSPSPAPSSNADDTAAFRQLLRKGEELVQQKQWSMALKELRAAVQLDDKSSRCHALLGVVYVNQKLAGMAKNSFQRAIQLNPKEPLALEYLASLNGQVPSAAKKPGTSSASPKTEPKKGGFFGWLGK
ncbi:MAG: DnaJ domain-containing protein [Oscillatoriales cyanobacterium SM2_2_1]|nr:DnaJ domain-containing protein [Oscillatoriales cyanobacterium SM2_2_1]